MLHTLTIVAGSPGAGKTTWAQAQVQLLGQKAVLVDDPSVDAARWGVIGVQHMHAFVADPHYTFSTQQEVCAMLERRCPHWSRQHTALKWVVLERPIEECLRNAR